MVTMFRECGWASWMMMLLGAFAFLVAGFGFLLAALRSKGAIAVAALGSILALFTFGIGPLGTRSGHVTTDHALAAADPAAREALRRQGYAEAQQCTNLSFGFGGFPLVVGLGAIVLALVRKPHD